MKDCLTDLTRPCGTRAICRCRARSWMQRWWLLQSSAIRTQRKTIFGKDCWIKPIRPQASGQTRRIAPKPTKTLWKSRALPQRFTGKNRISNLCHSISRNRMLESRWSDLVSSMSLPIRNRRHGTVHPNHRYHPGHHEDRPGQYCL